jgi:hypothetical protein
VHVLPAGAGQITFNGGTRGIDASHAGELQEAVTYPPTCMLVLFSIRPFTFCAVPTAEISSNKSIVFTGFINPPCLILTIDYTTLGVGP